MKKTKQNYQRTAALLGAQPRLQTRQPSRRMHLPRRSWRIMLPLVVVLAAVTWFFVDNRWYLMGEDLQVLGTSSVELAREVALASDLLGWHGLLLRPQEAQARISEAVTGITSVDVSCHRVPPACTVAITERTPVLIWQSDTVVYGVDEEGVLFPLKGEYPELPKVRGPLPGSEDDGIDQNIFQGVEALMALGIPLDAFEYRPHRGLVWVDAAGRRVAFGTGPEMALRWQVYTALVTHLEEKGIFPKAVDVRFAEGVTYSMESAW